MENSDKLSYKTAEDILQLFFDGDIPKIKNLVKTYEQEGDSLFNVLIKIFELIHESDAEIVDDPGEKNPPQINEVVSCVRSDIEKIEPLRMLEIAKKTAQNSELMKFIKAVTVARQELDQIYKDTLGYERDYLLEYQAGTILSALIEGNTDAADFVLDRQLKGEPILDIIRKLLHGAPVTKIVIELKLERRNGRMSRDEILELMKMKELGEVDWIDLADAVLQIEADEELSEIYNASRDRQKRAMNDFSEKILLTGICHKLNACPELLDIDKIRSFVRTQFEAISVGETVAKISSSLGDPPPPPDDTIN